MGTRRPDGRGWQPESHRGARGITGGSLGSTSDPYVTALEFAMQPRLKRAQVSRRRLCEEHLVCLLIVVTAWCSLQQSLAVFTVRPENRDAKLRGHGGKPLENDAG